MSENTFDPKIAEIAAQFDRSVAAETGANVNTGTRHGGQSVTHLTISGGDYHAGNYAETVHGDQTSR